MLYFAVLQYTKSFDTSSVKTCLNAVLILWIQGGGASMQTGLNPTNARDGAGPPERTLVAVSAVCSMN